MYLFQSNSVQCTVDELKIIDRTTLPPVAAPVGGMDVIMTTEEPAPVASSDNVSSLTPSPTVSSQPTGEQVKVRIVIQNDGPPEETG